MKVAYIRVSTAEQNTARQEEALKGLGIEKFFDKLKERTVNRGGEIRPISDGTIFKFYRVLRAVFNRAVEWELLPVNPVMKISKYAKPKERHAKRKIYQSKDLECFLKAL